MLGPDLVNGKFLKHHPCGPELKEGKDYHQYTERGGSSFVRFLRQEFGKFFQLVGRYCSYLLPKQTGRTTQILIFKTLRIMSRPSLYPTQEISEKIQGDTSGCLKPPVDIDLKVPF